MFSRDITSRLDRSIGIALKDYFNIATNQRPSRSRVARNIPAEFCMELDDLLSEHDKLRADYNSKFIETSWNGLRKSRFFLLRSKNYDC